jgi:arginyl-tRNA synthetase
VNAIRWCRDEIIACVGALTGAGRLPDGLDLARLTVEPAYREASGDLSTNAALVLATSAGLPPGVLAEGLAAALRARPAVESVAICHGGLVTWRLAPSFWQARLRELVRAGPRYGDSDVGRGQAITIRGPATDLFDFLPLVQVRAAIFAEALATLLTKVGFALSRAGLTDDPPTAARGDRTARSVRHLRVAAVAIDACPGGLICQPVERAARSDDALIFDDLTLGEIDRQALRFIMLTRPHGQAQQIDLNKVRDPSHDNPAWLVQHAYARIQSVLRHAIAELDLPDLGAHPVGADPTPLTDPAELALMRRLAGWPSVIDHAAVTHAPHHAAIFLEDLASDFHRLWNKGKDHATLRFVDRDDRVTTLARLALLQGVAAIIASGLRIVGIEPVREMR